MAFDVNRLSGMQPAGVRTSPVKWASPNAAPVQQSGQFGTDSFRPQAAHSAPSAPIHPPGIWDRVRSFVGMPATTTQTASAKPVTTTAPSRAGAIPSPESAVWSRLKSILGFGPATTTNAPTATHSVTPAQLKQLGQSDKPAFFRAMLPAALRAERLYGVPASVTLAQAAWESGWAKKPIAGYNVFGIKGSGSAGTTSVMTTDKINGKFLHRKQNFAVYRNFDDAILAHGKLFHNGNYAKGISDFARNRDPVTFIFNVAGAYATGDDYARAICQVMQENNLVAMARSVGGT